jgi:hypothetical protein
MPGSPGDFKKNLARCVFVMQKLLLRKPIERSKINVLENSQAHFPFKKSTIFYP